MVTTTSLASNLRYITQPALRILWVPFLYQFFHYLGTVFVLWEIGDRSLNELGIQGNQTIGPDTFDFIVVGAGSAGSIVANRLSSKYSVLLIEAGGEPNPIQFIPGFALFLLNREGIDWRHLSVPQKYGSLASLNGQSIWSAGIGLGGTGNINYMVHLRGHRLDYDNWAALTGDQSWSWEGVLPYFNKYEHYYDDKADPRYHGFKGELSVELPAHVGMGPEFVRAGEEIGYPSVDANAEFTEGFDIIKFATRSGVRDGPYKAFIQSARRRRTLTIRKYALATKVLLDSNNAAYGVEYLQHNLQRVAYATKEVIVCAGTITTPKLLMLSGIGPADHLQELGIPVRANLPVGQELKDHLAVIVAPFLIDQPRSLSLERDITPTAYVQWFTGGRGVLSSPGAPACGIISSDTAKRRGEGNWPDLVLYLYAFSHFKTFPEEISRSFNFKADEVRKYLEGYLDKEAFMVAVSGARPLSKGYIKLGGVSPHDKLIIDPQYLTDQGHQDVRSLVDGIKTTMRLVLNTTSIGHNMNARFTDRQFPGCEHLPFHSDAYWECYARKYSVTAHHPTGTCGMGRVVDTQLRVYGTQRLRVIDNSIQPEIVTTNTQAAAFMIAEKGVDMVLQYWAQQPSSDLRTQNPFRKPFLSFLGNLIHKK